LEAIDPQMAQVVKLRYFGGLTVDETAQALGESSRSINRSWTAARAWLKRRMDPS
jgi:DNA-directed RNA polymerase specialized sigma24 family protein